MSKIPTAKEFLVTQFNDIPPHCKDLGQFLYDSDIEEIMIKFANLHIQEALKTALDEIPYGGSDEIRYEDVVHILDCYPLENIK